MLTFHFPGSQAHSYPQALCICPSCLEDFSLNEFHWLDTNPQTFQCRDFPGSPMVRLRVSTQGTQFLSLVGELRSCMLCTAVKKKNKTKPTSKQKAHQCKHHIFRNYWSHLLPLLCQHPFVVVLLHSIFKSIFCMSCAIQYTLYTNLIFPCNNLERPCHLAAIFLQ